MEVISVKPIVEIANKMELAINRLLILLRGNSCWSLSVSGGKDSTTVLFLALEAMRRAKAEGINQAHHYISTAETTVENVAMQNHLHGFLDDIEVFCRREGLPVSIHTVKPSLPAQFVVSTIGRGTLVRTVQNSVKDGKRKRPCTTSWKVEPQQRLQRVLLREAALAGYGEPIVLLGNRFAESTSRSTSMDSRGENAETPVRNSDGFLTFSPIADWTTDDVWFFLAQFTNEKYYPFPAAASTHTVSRLHDLYREANEGTCGVVLGEGGNRAACGARTGCWTCCISGDTDKSLESMVKEPKHSYMAGMNQFRNYLLATEWDMSKREMVGRTLSKAGYIRVQPDTYSFHHRMNLLYMLLTLDANEIERAEQHEAAMGAGTIPDTPENRELCSVQFEIITPQQLVLIDWFLSMHHYCPHGFPALSAWYDVRVLGRRRPVPVITEPVPKEPLSRAGWYKVGQFDAEVPTDGLRDYAAEMWNPYRHPERISTYAQTTSGDRVVYFEETDQLTVDAAEACLFVTATFNFEMCQQVQAMSGLETARFWLNEGVIRLPKGMSQKYQTMAVRGQYFANLATKLNVTPAALDKHLVDNAISEIEHNTLLLSRGPSLFDEETTADEPIVLMG